MVGLAAQGSEDHPAPPPPDSDPAPESVIVTVPTGSPGPVDLQPSLPPPATAKPFDLGATYAAMADVDLTACEGRGLTKGYGKVQATYAPDGTVRRVAIALPPSSSESARACVGQAFGGVRVAPFAGTEDVDVVRAYFVG